MNAVTNPPSVPFPENAERCTASRAESGQRPASTKPVLDTCFEASTPRRAKDKVIGHLFYGVAEWEKHIAKITTFWSSVGLLTGRYHGQPLAAHFPLPLEPLVLFEQTARQVCTPEGADYLMDKTHRIARSLEMGIAVSRGELPSRLGGGHEH